MLHPIHFPTVRVRARLLIPALLRQFGLGIANRNAPFLALFPLQAAWLLKAVTCIDLTTLSGDDAPSNVQRLCFKAKHPIREDLLKALDMHDKGMVAFGVCISIGDGCVSLLFSHFLERTLVHCLDQRGIRPLIEAIHININD